MNRDRSLVYSAAFLRACATGAVGVLLGIYLARLGLGTGAMGLVIGSGLAGQAAAALLATVAGDRLGRRRLLAAFALAAGAGPAAVSASSTAAVLVAAAFLGMVNGMGRDRGPALVLEQALVPALAEPRDRTRVFAWYNLLGDAGHGVGALVAMAPAGLRAWGGMSELASLRWTLAVCGLVALATAPLALALSPGVEAAPRTEPRPPLTPASRRIVTRVSALFAIDALGGGFLTTSWLAYFFDAHFHASALAIGALFLGARLANAVSHLGAAWLASRIGLVNTMVFTHLPSSLLLVGVVVAPSFPVAAVLLLIREGLVQMDVPTRQSYLMAVVQPEERVVVSGVTHLVRLGAWAAGPFVAGWLMAFDFVVPFALGAGLKASYDVLLWLSFRNLPPPEERPSTAASSKSAASTSGEGVTS